MNMHTPPENQGQMVEVSYGWDAERFYRRTLDKSDGAVRWDVAVADEALADYQASSSEVWNESPPSNLSWRSAPAPF